MNPFEVSCLVNHGFEIASHGYFHKNKFTEQSKEELDYELRESQRYLSGFLPGDDVVDTLCVPFSAYNSKVEELVSKYYSVARVYGNRFVSKASFNSLNLNSVCLRACSDIQETKAQIDEAINTKSSLIFMLHGVVETKDELSEYAVTVDFLRSVLDYISVVDPEKLKVVTLGRVSAELRRVTSV